MSSTAIREKLLSGDLEGANRMLGAPYEISGTVVNGKHEGSRIGFPTANIRTEEHKLLPAFGVYACRMACGEESWEAVVNIGTQPTSRRAAPRRPTQALRTPPERVTDRGSRVGRPAPPGDQSPLGPAPERGDGREPPRRRGRERPENFGKKPKNLSKQGNKINGPCFPGPET